MTAGLATVATANAMLNGLRAGGAAFGPPAGTYAQIHTGDPGAAGTSNVSVGSTTRSALAQSAASSGAIAESGTAPSFVNGGTSETLTHISVWSAATGGTFLYSIALTSSKPWASGDTFTLTTCGIALAPLAA